MAKASVKFLFHGVGNYLPASARIGPACWPHHDVIVVQQGEIELTVAGEEMVLQTDDAVMIPPGAAFSGGARSGASVIWVLHYTGFCGEAASPFTGAEPWVVRRAATRPLVTKAMQEFSRVWKARRSGSREASLLGEWLLLQFERVASEQPERRPIRLREAVAMFQEGRFDLEVAEVARLSGYSPSRFRKLFNLHYGMSPQLYFFRARIDEGKRLLEETRLPIKEIAPRLGYADVAAFHRAFKRTASLSPARWREQYGGVV